MKFRPVFFFLLLACLCVIGRDACAQVYHGERLVTPTLLADTTAIAPGKPFTAGVLLKTAPGWHTYWLFSGDSGMPSKITWELPAGFSAGAIQWPIPQAHPSEGDQLTYVYGEEVLLLVEITPPAQLPAEPINLKAKASWLVCKETCIPGKGDLSLTLPVEAAPAAANAELFAQWRALLPKTGPAPFKLEWKNGESEVQVAISGLEAGVKAEFFPLPPAGVKPGHPQVSEPVDGSVTVKQPFEGSAPEWNAVIVLQKDGAPRQGWQVASGKTALAAIAPVTEAPSPKIASPTEPKIAEPPAAAPPSVTPGAPAGSAPTAASILPNPTSLLATLWAAFLGGLILNLMPCVLPVIALKIFGFVQQAGEEPRRVFRLGLAFVAGVFTFFASLAMLVVAFQSAGHGLTWGFQFQNPYILAGLIALIVLFALSMFGIFEITLGSGTATALDSLSRKDGYSGAFAHGLFTTLLGTSCTAPFLGGVLGFAFVQPAPIVFLVFLTIAAGMSLPYFLLTWQPAWMRFLPKPGVWMERMKQFMGFVMLGVALWLLSVLQNTVTPAATLTTYAFLLVLGIAGWIYGFSRSAGAKIVVLALLAGGWFFLIQGRLTHKPSQSAAANAQPTKDGIAWQPFTPERLIGAVGRGQPVFIDFTADWCLNCIYNERTVIETEAVRAAFREKNILTLKADWTNEDPAITAMLKSFGRVGVPAYALYLGSGTEKPVILPEILTRSVLLKALSEVKPFLAPTQIPANIPSNASVRRE